MRFLILIHSNPASRALWETLTEQQQIEFGRNHLALSDQLAASGELVSSEGLPDPSLSIAVSVRDGQVVTSDGPFAEVKEYLAGYYLIDCDTRERAIEIAALVPDAENSYVELRPVFDLSTLDL